MAGSKSSGNVAKLRNIINVLDPRWGAKGDGVTDDTAAVQAAITYAIANNLDVEVDGKCRLTAPVNIDRLVDGAAFDKYFRIFSKTGGGFYVTTATNMFSSSIAFAAAPVSQLVLFEGVYFESNIAAARYVLDGGRFLRTRFLSCTFDKILGVNSTIYTQSLQLMNCNMRRGSGTFWKATSMSLDFKFIGNICEAWTGNFLDLAMCQGTAIIGNLIEGVTGTAIVYNGAKGFTISGNYFESNGLDIDGTGATQAAGVALLGNHFSHAPAGQYSVIWGNGAPIACVSMGNYHNGSMHDVPAGADVLIKDVANTSTANNTTTPQIPTNLTLTSGKTFGVGITPIVVGTQQIHAAANATLALTDNVLGSSYGGAIRGYGVGGQGGYVELGSYDAGAYTAHLTITQTGAAQLKGSAPSLQVGAPAGGDKGSGTANFAADIYKNNTAYANPDYVFEKFYTGRIVKFAHKDGASSYKGRFSLTRLRAYTKRYLHLPGFGQKAGHGAFSGADRLLATVEELTLHIFDLHDRIKKLEAKR